MSESYTETKIFNRIAQFLIWTISIAVLNVNSIKADDYDDDDNVYLEEGQTYFGDEFDGNVYIIGVTDVSLIDVNIDGDLFIKDSENIFVVQTNIDGDLRIINSNDLELKD